MEPHDLVAAFQPHLSLDSHCCMLVCCVQMAAQRCVLASNWQSERALQSASEPVVAQLVEHEEPVHEQARSPLQLVRSVYAYLH